MSEQTRQQLTQPAEPLTLRISKSALYVAAITAYLVFFTSQMAMWVSLVINEPRRVRPDSEGSIDHGLLNIFEHKGVMNNPDPATNVFARVSRVSAPRRAPETVAERRPVIYADAPEAQLIDRLFKLSAVSALGAWVDDDRGV